jgi:hypothetical protein
MRVVGVPVASPTPTTRALYASDWAHFVAWCRQQRRTALPASAGTLASYLIAIAPGRSRGSLGRCRAAVGAMHRMAGLPVPLLDAAAHAALRRTAKPKALRSTPTATSLVRIAQTCPRDLAGLRDRALLLLAATLSAKTPIHPSAEGPPGAATARRGRAGVPKLFLLGLDAEHVRFTATGVVLDLRTRMDEAVPSRSVTLTRAAAAACPVRALEDWLRHSDTAFGPVFRKVDRWGNVEHGRLAPDAWHRILARRSGASNRRVPKPGER